mgnify:CR=1 FL=1
MMPLQNRVQPNGEILALSGHGRFMGNRGILHSDNKSLSHIRWRHKAWVTCLLSFKGRKRPLMAPKAYTELFFLDEATAMAAGHRPCGYCRRADYLRFVDAWAEHAGTRPKAPQMDKALHAARIVPRTRKQLRHQAPLRDLPEGAMILRDGTAYLLLQDAVLPYRRAHYGPPQRRSRTETVTVLTPVPMLNVLRAGFIPALHASADLSVTASD